MATIILHRETPHRLFEQRTGKLLETKIVEETEFDDGTFTVLEKNKIKIGAPINLE